MVDFKPVKFFHYLNSKILILPTWVIAQVNYFMVRALRNMTLTKEDPYNIRLARIKFVPLIFLTFYSKIQPKSQVKESFLLIRRRLQWNQCVPAGKYPKENSKNHI